MPDPSRVFLLGPTASGKSAVAVELALLLKAEILCLDSMTIYRGMDVGTAKPCPAERARVPHHLLDLVDPSEDFSVARWLDAARVAESEVRGRGARPLFVGGTGLYLKALTAGLLEIPAVPETLRRDLRAELQRDGAGPLREELRRVDPVLWARLPAGDERRLLRGLEVFRATGLPLSSFQKQWRGPARLGAPAVALQLPREALREAVEARFDRMLAGGLVTEVERLRAQNGFGATAARALGYRQILEHLEGRIPLEEARRRAIGRTRVLIRRQMTWLRSFADLAWVGVNPGDSPACVAKKVRKILEARRFPGG